MDADGLTLRGHKDVMHHHTTHPKYQLAGELICLLPADGATVPLSLVADDLELAPVEILDVLIDDVRRVYGLRVAVYAGERLGVDPRDTHWLAQCAAKYFADVYDGPQLR